MQAIRLARPRVSLRRLATTAQAPTSAPSSSASASIIPLSNVEAQWEKMTKSEQAVVHRQLEELQKKDWKTLSLDEKKAGTFFVLPFFGSIDVSYWCAFLGLSTFVEITQLSSYCVRLKHYFPCHARVNSILCCFWPAWTPGSCQPTRPGPQGFPFHYGSCGRRWTAHPSHPLARYASFSLPWDLRIYTP